jgi:DNA recombination protein RmuC
MSTCFRFILVYYCLIHWCFHWELIFLLVFARKISLEEKLIAFSSQFNQLKEQLLNDKTIFEKQLENSIIEKETIRNRKDSLAIQLSKKEVDFENLWERNRDKKTREKLQDKFTRSLRISLIKY